MTPAERAYRLGTIDRMAGRPALDVADEESAVLMERLGQTGPTTAANHPERLAMCDAYLNGWYDAASAGAE